MELLDINQYHRPSECSKCGGKMIFKGVGEYQCERCGAIDYDDYGKVRMYIEEHKGATAAQIEDAIGIKQKVIRQMLKEERLEVARDSKAFLQCEICGISIRSGKYCEKCASAHGRVAEEKLRNERIRQLQGFSMGSTKGENGEKRFKREH